MARFTGSDANETITPEAVSASVTRDPANSLPSDAADTISGGRGADILHGGGGGDEIYSDYRSLNTDNAIDQLYGDDGNDRLEGGTGDQLYGGAGDDRLIVYADRPAVLDGGDRNDLVAINFFDISGTSLVSIERSLLSGYNVASKMTADQLGHLGILGPQAGFSSIYARLTAGGEARDIVTDAAITILDIRGSSGADKLSFALGGTTRVHIDGAGGADILHGGSADDSLIGGSAGNDGADQLFGEGGNDSLSVGSGDEAYGGAGDDLLIVTGEPAILDGGSGDDTLQLASSDISSAVLESIERTELSDSSVTKMKAGQLADLGTLGSGWNPTSSAHISLTAGGASDAVVLAELKTLSVTGSQEADRLSFAPQVTTTLVLEGAGGADILHGGGGNDQLYDNRIGAAGDDAADQLYGEGGNDTLYVGTGDQAHGGAGDDTLVVVGDRPAILDGGQGTDTLRIGDYDISAAVLQGIERTELSHSVRSASALTVSQIESLGTLAALDHYGLAYIRLTAGGTIDDVSLDGLRALYIQGSDDVERLDFRAETGVRFVLQGGGGADVLHGSNSTDELYGNLYADSKDGAADRLYGEGGNDKLVVGAGDSAYGGEGNDRLIVGQSGVVLLDGGAGNDVLQIGGNDISGAGALLDGGAGDDLLQIGGNDISGATVVGIERTQLFSSEFASKMMAGQLDDLGTLVGAPGHGDAYVRLTAGGASSDVVTDAGIVTLHLLGSSGADEVSFAAGTTRFVLEGGDGSDVLHGGSGDDEIYGYRAFTSFDGTADRLYGEGGNDRIAAGVGDQVYGGLGNDTLTVIANRAAVLDGGAGNDVLWVGDYDISGAVLGGIERTRIAADGDGSKMTAGQLDDLGVILAVDASTSAAIRLTGGGTSSDIHTDPGLKALHIEGSTGADQLSFAAGTLTRLELEGGGGADVLHGGGGNDEISGYRLGASNDGAGDRLYGEGGNDWITLGTGDRGYGGEGNDTLVIDGNGPSLADGGGGDDLLIGGSGNDILTGGSGNDTASYFSSAADLHVSLALSGAQDTGGAGRDTLSGIDNLIGGSGNDHLTGDDFANVLEGGFGDDVLDGGQGSDTASYAGAWDGVAVSLARSGAQDTGGAGTDRLVGIENLAGSAFEDSLIGNGGANRLDGGAGDDRLQGGGGADTLLGGLGNDELTGGNGADLFVFKAMEGSDRVMDFTNGSDRLSFSGFGAGNDTAAEIIGHARQVGEDTVITLNDPHAATSTEVTLVHFALSDLDARDFAILIA